MAKRHLNYRLVKIHRSYSLREAASLFHVHKNTVLAWIKAGLAVVDDKRPTLILGRDLVAFLQARRAKNKKRCRPGEMYCVRCRSPRFPAGAMADYEAVTEKIGNLTGICPDCDTMMHRRVSASKLSHVCGNLGITFPEVLRHLCEISQHSLNSDFGRETSANASTQCQE